MTDHERKMTAIIGVTTLAITLEAEKSGFSASSKKAMEIAEMCEKALRKGGVEFKEIEKAIEELDDVSMLETMKSAGEPV